MTSPRALVRLSPSWSMDLLLAAGLAGLVIAARVVPHAWNFTPVVASALFAGMVFRSKSLALAVPVAAMVLSDLVIGREDWRVGLVVYASLLLPTLLGLWGRRYRAIVLIPLAISSSLVFFATTNFAVWAFSGMYSLDVDGLVRCFVAGLLFLRNTMTGDLTWTVVLFGSWYLAQHWISSQSETAAVSSR